MALTPGTRYMEWAVEVAASAAALQTLINTKHQDDPPSQTIDGQDFSGTRWELFEVEHDGTQFVAIFQRKNIAV